MHYLTRWRMHLAAHQLRSKGLGVSEAAERVGYESTATFSKALKRYLGEAPAAYRRGLRKDRPTAHRGQVRAALCPTPRAILDR